MKVSFANESKLRAQMARRGWTEQQVIEALQTEPVPAMGHRGPARRYIHPVTGRSVVVDDASGQIFHVGGDGFVYD